MKTSQRARLCFIALDETIYGIERDSVYLALSNSIELVLDTKLSETKKVAMLSRRVVQSLWYALKPANSRSGVDVTLHAPAICVPSLDIPQADRLLASHWEAHILDHAKAKIAESAAKAGAYHLNISCFLGTSLEAALPALKASETLHICIGALQSRPALGRGGVLTERHSCDVAVAYSVAHYTEENIALALQKLRDALSD